MPPISLAPSLSILVYVFLLVVSNLACVTSIESSPHTYREIQPDGKTTPPLKIRGGPQLHYVTDANGYTVIQDDDRWFVYADEGSDETGRLSSSGMRVGMGAPEKKGIHKGILPGWLGALVHTNRPLFGQYITGVGYLVGTDSGSDQS